LLHRIIKPEKERAMENVQLPIQLAPSSLYQPILPGWQLSLFSVNVGASSDADMEKAAIQQVGSYGKQLGHLAEALEIVIKHQKLLESKLLSDKQKDVLQVFLGDVSTIRAMKTKLIAA
jgi:hypothetical protein